MYEYIEEGKLYRFIDSFGVEDEIHIVIALESEELFSWHDDFNHEASSYDLVAILKNDTLAYAWPQDLEEII